MNHNKRHSQYKSNYIELIGILCAIAIIFTIWISYPRFMQFMDEPLSNENPKVIVPFKPNLEKKAVESESESKFQKVGETYGTYGDSYGSLNTLFSGLAFAVLIISLFMQRQELRAQREELEAQRNEIKESNAIADAQREIAEKQRLITEQQAELNKQQIQDAKVQNFYNLLFKLLDEKKNKVKSLEIARDSQIKGNYVFDRFIYKAENTIKLSFSYHIENLKKSNKDKCFSVIVASSKEAQISTKNTLIEEEYFEYICFILRYIKDHDHLKTTNNAIKIFISYQTINEMYAMFITSISNCYCQKNNELSTFITDYALLRKINTYHKEDDFFPTIINKTLGEDSYIPKSHIK